MDKLIGGNATNGKIENGIYYVMSSDEVFIEVPKSTFIVSYVISCFVTLSIVFGVISLIILQIKAANSSFMKGEKKMIFIYTWIFFIFFLSVFLNGYLYKKYDDVISMLGFKKKKFLPLEIVSLKVLKNSKDERVKKVYIIILLYKIIYFSAMAFFWIYIIIKNLE